MRFLMLNWRDPANPQAGGAERVSLAYLKELVRRGHGVWWFSNAFPGAKPGEILEGIHFVRGGGKGTSILRARQWYRQQQRFDLVIDQHHGLPWYAPWWSGTNCVAYVHEVLGPIWGAFYPWPISALGKWQEAWTMRRYGHIPFWTPSASTRKLLEALGVRSVKVIPNGCDTEPVRALIPKPLLPPFRLVTVSRLAPNKRIDHAIRAAALLRSRSVDVHLTVIGGGDENASLVALANSLGVSPHVTFAGALPEPEKNRALQQAHWLVHTSLREGWGLNVIEANAMGTPAVVYPVAGLVDSTVDGITGKVVEKESPEQLANVLETLFQNPERYTQLRTNAWKRSLDFAWSKVLPLAADWLEGQAANCGQKTAYQD